MIPYGKQTIDEGDINEVSRILRGDYLTTGPEVNKFEEDLCKYLGCKYAVAVSSGTAALHLACLAMGLKEGEEIITSPLTFVASANCALYCGARPAFADIKQNGLIDESKIEKNITKKTKIIIPVHYAGLPCEMEEIMRIAKKNNLIVIEDACHALGAKYKDSKIGDCRYSNMCVFSFHPVKHITTGEGGAITTNSKEIYEKLKELRNHGITREKSKFLKKSPEPWHYEMQDLGFNYRITDFQCALAISQLKKINLFIQRRKEIANYYESAFKKIKELEIIEDKEKRSSYHLYVIKARNEKERLELFNFLKSEGIFCQVHYIPVYTQPYYKKLGYKNNICPVSEDFYSRAISLPIYPSLKNEEQEFIIQKIKDFFNQRETI